MEEGLLLKERIESNDFYRISVLMLATLIQRYKNHFIFDPVKERETN